MIHEENTHIDFPIIPSIKLSKYMLKDGRMNWRGGGCMESLLVDMFSNSTYVRVS